MDKILIVRDCEVVTAEAARKLRDEKNKQIAVQAEENDAQEAEIENLKRLLELL